MVTKRTTKKLSQSEVNARYMRLTGKTELKGDAVKKCDWWGCLNERHYEEVVEGKE